jgi:hypothetical protein
MPRTPDLTGSRVGRLKILGPLKERDAHGRRMWRCRCDCGDQAAVCTSALVGRHTASCGCLRKVSRPRKAAHQKVINRALAAGDVYTDARGEFYAPRKAARYLGVSDVTLAKYQDVGGARCCWREGGKPILTTPVKMPYRKEAVYSYKPHLDEVRLAMVERVAPAQVAQLVDLGELADGLGWHVQSVRRLYRQWCKRLKKKAVYTHNPGVDALGRASRRPYVPAAFALWFRERCGPSAAAGCGAAAAPAKKRRGPQVTKGTLDLGEFCYRRLAAGDLRRVICRRVRECFGRVFDEPDVTTYARRYATHPDINKPWPVSARP